MNCLLLATASPARVARAAADLARRHPGSRVTIGATSRQERVLAARGLATVRLGGSDLALDDRAVRASLAAGGYDLVVVPLDLPLQPLLFVVRLADHLAAVPFELWLGRRLHCRRRRVVRPALLTFSWLLYPPLGLLVRAGRVADGALLLALHALARLGLRLPGRGPRAATVAHVITSLGVGGAERQLTTYLRHSAIPPAGTVVLVLDAWAAPELLAAVEATGATLEVVGDQVQELAWARLASRFVPRFVWALLVARRLRAWRPACVVSWLFLANAVTVPVARLCGCPRVVSSVRNLSAWKTWPEFRGWWFRAADRSSARLSDVVVGNSRAVAADFATWAEIDPSTVRTIYNGVDADSLAALPASDVRAELGIPVDLPLVLAVGRLSPEKSFTQLVAVMAELRASGSRCHLVIVGDGLERAVLAAQITALDLDDVVHLVGLRRDVHSFYRAADLFVLSSLIEGMPNVVMEAQLLAVPVVCTASGGTVEVVEDGVTGLVVPVDDPAALHAAVAALLADPERRREMGRRGAERMRAQFSMAASAAALDALIGEGRGAGA